MNWSKTKVYHNLVIELRTFSWENGTERLNVETQLLICPNRVAALSAMVVLRENRFRIIGKIFRCPGYKTFSKPMKIKKNIVAGKFLWQLLIAYKDIVTSPFIGRARQSTIFIYLFKLDLPISVLGQRS